MSLMDISSKNILSHKGKAMHHKIFIMFFVGFSLISIPSVLADEESPVIEIKFHDGDIIDLDAGTQMIRANVKIHHYNPQDGYHFMEVYRVSDETVIKQSEILPTHIEDDVYGVQILHYLDPSGANEDLIGDYELRVYSEYGTAETSIPFSIIKSSQTPIVAQNSKILEVVNEENSDELEQEEVVESESQIPEWIHDIFVWFAEGEIGEDDLLSAIKYLVESDIIVLDN